MFDESLNLLSDSSFFGTSSPLQTASLGTSLEASDLITPTVPNGLKGIDSSFLANSLEAYQLQAQNRGRVSQVASNVLGRGDLLIGQNGFNALSSSVDNAGNTLSSARVITVGASATNYTDFVGSTDTNDYYRFAVANTSNLNLSLTGLSSDADVELLNSSGAVITSSSNSGTTAESISRQLTAGTYYIRVFPYSSSTNYTGV